MPRPPALEDIKFKDNTEVYTYQAMVPVDFEVETKTTVKQVGSPEAPKADEIVGRKCVDKPCDLCDRIDVRVQELRGAGVPERDAWVQARNELEPKKDGVAAPGEPEAPAESAPAEPVVETPADPTIEPEDGAPDPELEPKRAA